LKEGLRNWSSLSKGSPSGANDAGLTGNAVPIALIAESLYISHMTTCRRFFPTSFRWHLPQLAGPLLRRAR
jgi:hypothetical protein